MATYTKNDVAGYPTVDLFAMSVVGFEVKELTPTRAVFKTPYDFEIVMTGRNLDITVKPLPDGKFDFIGSGTVESILRTNIGGTLVYDSLTGLANIPFSRPANIDIAVLKSLVFAQDDVFIGDAKDNSFDGAGGRDTFVIAALKSEVQITTSGTETILVSSQGRDTLTNIEVIRFSDGQTLDLTTGGSALGAATAYYPAAAITQVVTGSDPTTAQMDVRSKAAQAAYDYYANVLKVADPSLGPYESLGVSFSSLDVFRAKYGSSAGSDGEFITKTYKSVFLRDATDAQQKHFASQISYFSELYLGAGLDAVTANMQARGAVLGQMIGFVMTSPTEQAAAGQLIDDKAVAFVKSVGLAGTSSAAMSGGSDFLS